MDVELNGDLEEVVGGCLCLDQDNRRAWIIGNRDTIDEVVGGRDDRDESRRGANNVQQLGRCLDIRLQGQVVCLIHVHIAYCHGSSLASASSARCSR